MVYEGVNSCGLYGRPTSDANPTGTVGSLKPSARCEPEPRELRALSRAERARERADPPSSEGVKPGEVRLDSIPPSISGVVFISGHRSVPDIRFRDKGNLVCSCAGAHRHIKR